MGSRIQRLAVGAEDGGAAAEAEGRETRPATGTRGRPARDEGEDNGGEISGGQRAWRRRLGGRDSWFGTDVRFATR